MFAARFPATQVWRSASIAIVTAALSAPLEAETVVYWWHDVAGDGDPDLTAMSLVFDDQTGDYELTLETYRERPLRGLCRVNVTLENLDLGATPTSLLRRRDVDFQLGEPTTALVLRGTSEHLRLWRAGHCVLTTTGVALLSGKGRDSFPGDRCPRLTKDFPDLVVDSLEATLLEDRRLEYRYTILNQGTVAATIDDVTLRATLVASPRERAEDEILVEGGVFSGELVPGETVQGSVTSSALADLAVGPFLRVRVDATEDSDALQENNSRVVFVDCEIAPLEVPTTFPTIQSALEWARDGATIVVLPGEYEGPIEFNALGDSDDPIAPAIRDVTLQSRDGPAVTTVRGGVRFVRGETGDSVLRGFTLTGGELDCRDSSPTIEGCAIVEHSGPGMLISSSSAPTLRSCTVSRNWGPGIDVSAGSSVYLESCIVWGNAGGSISTAESARVLAGYSCIEGPDLLPGEGNIDVDPRFCGWDDVGDVWCDPAAPPGGDGSEASPHQRLADALEYSLALANDSSARGAGLGGEDMGAGFGTCQAAGVASRLVHVAAGDYEAPVVILASGASLEGAGADATVIHGALVVMHGTTVRGVRVVESFPWPPGFLVAPAASPLIEEVRARSIHCAAESRPDIRRSTISGGGISCARGSAPRIQECRIAGFNWYDPESGAGIYCGSGSSPEVIDSAVTGNNGIICESGSSLTLSRTLIVYYDFEGIRSDMARLDLENTIVGGWDGDAGLQARAGEIRIVNSTLTDIQVFDSDEGDPPAKVTILNSIVAYNGLRVPGDADIRVSFSLIQGGFPGGESILDADPLFVFDDAEEPTYRLRADSPAIDFGSSEGAPAVDIEGQPRPCGAAVDLGAYEYCASPRFRRGDVDGNGLLEITDPTADLNYQFLGEFAPRCLDAHDFDDNGLLEITDPIANLEHQFLGKAPPPAPGRASCGVDPTEDTLDCESYTCVEAE